MKDHFILKKPLVTERTTDLNILGKYVFIVASNATKPEVKKAVKEIYKADVVSVNMINRAPKRKRLRGIMNGKRSGYKKAIVTLKEGQKIETR
jgi:large subunit ribosomal protein L23